jgi:Zn-dependent protease with chaperone function
MSTTTAETALYLDGRSNRKRSVALRFADRLDILEHAGAVESWPYDQIRRADGPPETLRLRCATALPLARLEVSDAATQEAIVARCKSLYVGHASSTQTWRIVFWSLAAVCSILGLAFFGIPFAADRLAPMVPAAVERRIGEAVDRQARAIFGGKTCDGADGQAAFTSLIDKLRRAGEIDIPLDASVLSADMANAFALPGGKVYLLDGLLQKARDPDEIAGVLAHELGHVRHRDSLRKIIQTGGTSFLIGLLFGDVTGGGAMVFIGRSLFDASYSREAERAADAFAMDVMHKLGRSAKPMGEFLFRVTGAESGKTLSILASHPLTEERRDLMAREARANTGPEILSPGEWRALKNICRARSTMIPKAESQVSEKTASGKEGK